MSASLELELETDAIDKDQLEDWGGEASTCNGWSFWYIENVNENAVVKDIYSQWGQEHCVVYDPDLDATIDPTLGQFEDAPFAGAWDGEEHPYAMDGEEVYEWTDREEFAEHYSQHPNGPYIV